jgi:hypothetical protein
MLKMSSLWLGAVSLLAGCASIPAGPGIAALPSSGRSFLQFQHDDYYCRQFAYEQIGGTTPTRAAISSSVASAAIGAALGAAAGAVFGGGRGAAIGAGTGLVAGSLAGTHTAGASAHVSQQRYDNGYMQCMYGKGHRVPAAPQTFSSPYPPSAGQYMNRTSPSYFPHGGGQRISFPPPPPPPAGIPPPPPPR